ncbi:hypothetical protein BU16DRAFT_565276 [Lophium mytilinum]|uniref:Uncharacterized protein n=1 Tax=Lophium mytilinum TaxID=390894 RepID=A0A6A6QHQ9_9PEZI|nr:hypothetical protein BU16DRAFT_565276 [Lophium mytilinum]
MSISESTADLGKAGQDVKAARAKEDADELAKLDAIIDRIRKVVPTEPYILSTPTDLPYHRVDDQERRSWMIGDLWEPREEYRQYQTWQYRDREDTVYALRSAVDERMQKEAALASSKNRLKSNFMATPAAGAKKMSYSDYAKAKQANGTLGTPLSKKPSPELGPVQPQQAQKPQTNGIKPVVNGHPAPVQAPVQQGQKRALDVTPSDLLQDILKEAGGDAPPPAKKLKPASPRPAQHSKSSSNASSQSNSTPHGLPPMLSPTSFPNPYGLPPILSPTLPANVQAELARIESRKRADSNVSSSSSSQLLSVPELKNKRSDESLKGVARKVLKNGEVKSRIDSAESKIATSTPVRNHVRDEPQKESPVKAVKRLMVKLKYGRKNRNQVERFLRLPAASQKKERQAEREKERQAEKEKDRQAEREKDRQAEREELLRMKERATKNKLKQEERDRAEAKAKQDAAKEKVLKSALSTPALKKVSATMSDTSATSKSAKRPRESDDVPTVHSKRVKAPAELELDKRPSTPSDQAIPSPALTTASSAQKSGSHLITPRKDLRALNMIRAISSPGNDSTPGRGSTPTISSKPVDGKTSVPASQKNETMRRSVSGWLECQKKATDIGRNLKHDATRIEGEAKTLKQGAKDATAMRIALMSIDCILAFMIAFHAGDASQHVQSRPPNIDNTWRTLLTLTHSFKPRTVPYRDLENLRITLASIIATRIANQPRPSNISNMTTAEAAQAYYNLNKDMNSVMRLSAEATTALPTSTIIEKYPQTWELRSRATPQAFQQKDFGNHGELTGPFWLPIGPCTFPIHGVRFGIAYMNEFMEHKGTDYGMLKVQAFLDRKADEA